MSFNMDLNKALAQFGEEVKESMQRGLDIAAEHFIREARANFKYHGPRRHPGTARYPDSLIVEDRFIRSRYIGSTKTVTGKKGKKIPLSNILENGRYPDGTGANPILRTTFDRIQNDLADDVIREIEKGK